MCCWFSFEVNAIRIWTTYSIGMESCFHKLSLWKQIYFFIYIWKAPFWRIKWGQFWANSIMQPKVKYSFVISIHDRLSTWAYSPFIFHSFPTNSSERVSSWKHAETWLVTVNLDYSWQKYSAWEQNWIMKFNCNPDLPAEIFFI